MPLGLSFLLSKKESDSSRRMSRSTMSRRRSRSRSKSSNMEGEGKAQKKLAEASRELSCVSMARQLSARTVTSQRASKQKSVGDPELTAKKREHAAMMAQELVDHLKSIAPFNKRWEVIETINQGTYGVVFLVKDVETKVFGVIKVAKMMANDSGNASAEWEGFILEQMYKRNKECSIVRLLDKGMLEDQNCEGLEFIVLERATIPVKDYIFDTEGAVRKLRTCQIVLQMLKAIFDLHREGLLHRDLKPDNMGIFSRNQPVALVFDLGMARMYTDGECNVRVPRTCCYFRGTAEWASGHALKGREQTRFDDLIAWLYVAVELFATEKEPSQPLPWTYRNNSRAIRYLKSVYCPARYLLKNCPKQFYAINTYLMTANRLKAPNYRFLADTVNEAVQEAAEEVKREATAKSAPANQSVKTPASSVEPKGKSSTSVTPVAAGAPAPAAPPAASAAPAAPAAPAAAAKSKPSSPTPPGGARAGAHYVQSDSCSLSLDNHKQPK